jgi:POT family proton-dependent oligopeptide transporter
MGPETKAADEPGAAPAPAGRWPRQIKYIVGNEACERFSFYGMKGILALYITGVLLRSDDDATNLIALFGAANYFMPLLGAWVSDRYWGRYHTILWISLSYCVGHAVLATSDFIPTISGKTLALYVGLSLIAFGAGGIKPCVSAFMGDQFKPEQRHLLQKAYAAFYWSINLGSFFSFLVIPFIHKHWGYSWAFGVPGIFMAIATFVFWRGTNHYIRVPPSRETKNPGLVAVFVEAYARQRGSTLAPLLNVVTAIGLPLLAMAGLTFAAMTRQTTPLVRCVAWGALACIGVWYIATVVTSVVGCMELPESFWQAARNRYNEAAVAAARSVMPLLFVFALVPVFWALFDQSASTWVLQGQGMAPCELRFRFLDVAALFHHGGLQLTTVGWTIGSEEMQSANPLLIMLMLPVMTWGLYPRLGRLVTPLRRMSGGMFLAAFSYVVVAMLQARLDRGAHLSVLWQTVPYFILTIAEILVSTTGLEFAFREAAPETKSIIMGFWNLTITMGDLMVAGITKALASSHAASQNASVSASRFLDYAAMTFVVAILFSIVAAFYRYRDEAAARGE